MTEQMSIPRQWYKNYISLIREDIEYFTEIINDPETTQVEHDLADTKLIELYKQKKEIEEYEQKPINEI